MSEKRVYAKNRLIEEMYKGSCYGTPKCGTVEDIEAITEASLYEMWQNACRRIYTRSGYRRGSAAGALKKLAVTLKIPKGII